MHGGELIQPNILIQEEQLTQSLIGNGTTKPPYIWMEGDRQWCLTTAAGIPPVLLVQHPATVVTPLENAETWGQLAP